MGFDPFSIISPARVNILLVPAGDIRPERFEERVSQLRKHDIISLGDIVAHEQVAKHPGLFSPTVFAPGRVFLNYSTSVGAQWIDSFPFELNRTPQVVIALSDGNSAVNNQQRETFKGNGEVNATFDNLLRSFRESIDQDQRPLVHCLAIFDSSSKHALDEKLTWCPIAGDRQTGDVATFILSITASVLDVFDQLARDYKGVHIQSPHLIVQRSIKAHGYPATKNAFPQSDRLPAEVGQTSGIANGIEQHTESSPNDTSRSPSGGRFGFNSPKTAASTDSLPNSSQARYQILLGTLYLQAGRWPDALRELSEGAVATRGHVVDTAWHAHALECLLVCMILFAWAQLDFKIPQICYASVDKNQGGRWASLTPQVNENTSAESSMMSPHSIAKLAPGLQDAIVALHTNVSSTAQEQLPPLMLAELKIRLADLLAVICLQGGTLSRHALDLLVTGVIPKAGSPEQIGPPAVTIRKNLIANLFADAAEELPSNFPSKSSIDVLVAVSSRLSNLGLDRRQAFYLKNLLQKLIPGLVDARKIGAAELGFHPAAALSLQGSAINDASSSVRSGVKSVLDSVCEAYGLPRILTTTEQASFKSPDLATIKLNVSKWSEMQAGGDFSMKLEMLRICAGVCEALPDLESGLQYSTQLLASAKRSVTLSSNSRHDIPHISQDEQIRLLNNIKRTVGAANKMGMPMLRARYWDDFLVRDIELLDSSSGEKMISHTPQELSLLSNGAKNAPTDPFIYNPLAKSQKNAAGEAVLVVDETAYFSVLLQNAFEFDVEVDSISILSEGCDFEPSSHNIVLGHCCSQRFILSGVPRSEGTLRIIGCRARVKDCYEQDFLILPKPFFPPTLVKQRRNLSLQLSTSSSQGVPNSEPQTDVATAVERSTDSFVNTLTTYVRRAQPSISVEHTSLSLSSLMLLEGETRRLEVTLKNTSGQITADLLLFTFDDSVTRQVQEALANKSLSPLELYELQLQLSEKPALKWIIGDHSNRPSLQPGQSQSFTFEIFGKPGLMDGTIQIDYANLGRPQSEVMEKFYTRQIMIPISITVNGSIEIPRCNILPFFDQDMQMTLPSPNELKARAYNTDTNGQCLVLLDFRNVWPYPITISLQTPEDAIPHVAGDPGWSGNRGIVETLQPGHVSRSVLVVPRAFVEYSHAPIPTITTQRQFVVSASKVSIEAETASREAFWYREELLKSIKASWTEQETGRHGVIDIRRGIRLSARMIDALKVDPVDIRFTKSRIDPASSNTGSASLRVTDLSPLILPVGIFAKVVVRVHNRSQGKLHLLLRLQPSLRDQPHTLALDLSKRFAWSGMLQRPLHPALEPGEVREADLGITALASGRLEISATVEEIKTSRPERHLDGVNSISVGPERRIWHAREHCLINAVSSLNG